MKKIFFILLFLPFIVFSQSGSPDDYYNGFNFNQSSSDLKTALANLITSTSNLQSYNTAWDALKISDLASGSTTHVSLIYGYDNTDGVYKTDETRLKNENQTSSQGTGKWNREHVVSKSLADPSMSTSTGIGTDLHNLRAIDYQMNSSRSNKRFQDGGSTGDSKTITNDGDDGWYPGDGTGTGGDDYRGDVARIVMYMYLRYSDRVSANNVGLGNNTYHADMPDIFLEWNQEDLPSTLEINRNNTIESYQDNRNPFIDNPFLAYYIWGGPTISNWWTGTAIGSPSISFNSSNSVDENDSTTSANLSVTMSNYDSSDGNVVLTYSVNSGSTTAESGDYSYSPTGPNELTFNSNGTQTISITINSDVDNDDETLVFDFSISTASVELRNTQHTITVVDDEKPLIITEITDPNNDTNGRYVELYNPSASSISLGGLYLIRWTNDNTDPTASSAKKLSDHCGSSMAGNSFCILSMSTVSGFMSIYGLASDFSLGSGGVADSNGDDQIAIVLSDVASFNSSSYTILDIFGVPGEDGSGTAHEFEDGRAERKASSTTPSSSWASSDWNVENGTGGGDSTNNPQTAPADYDPGYWIGATTTDTWNGLSNTSWETAGNWASGTAPASGDKVYVRDATNNPDISTDISITNLTVKSSGALDILSNGSLSLSGNLTSLGTLKLNSSSNEFSSLIVQGTSSGNITYNRHVNSLSNGSGWDLIGSPVNGLQISSFVSANTSGSSPLATGNGSGAGATGEYAIGTYDSSNNTWTNYTQSVVEVDDPDFVPGKGYQMATDSGATLAFTGTVDTDATETISVESFTDASGRRWNLISNPYPSYITIGPSDVTDTFLEVNDDVIDDTYNGVYGYDANTDNDGLTELFDVYNNTSAGKIAPGQAFMIAARSTDAANITFKEEMQTVSGSDDFISGDVMENAEVELRVYNDDIGIGKTKLFFDEGLGMGLDRGWDAGHYYENASITTRLIEDDQGHGMAINAMGVEAMQNAVIPLVINQAAGQEFRINLHSSTIPNPNIYLEDVEEGTFTNLYEEDFVLTPTSNLSEVGRFFIHMSADTMSNEDVSTSMLNAYKEVNANYITIEGLATQSNNINVSLYNILGTKVFNASLSNNVNTQTLSTVGMASGIYVIKLESGSDILTKKLIIQ
ncbi:MAG: endonuclease [Flavobacteriaceae bacterium]|nr:endonuclease [Flavobacteriaceae bacterium]